MIKKNLLWIVLILTFAVRLISLNQSLWHDESGTVEAVSRMGLLPLITQYSIADFHPPGFFVILWGFVKVFGNSEVASRMPSVLFAVGTVLFTYLIAKKLYFQRVGILSALFLALGPLSIYYSQEARMYSMSALAVSASFYFLLRLIKNEKYALIGYALSALLIFYSDYVAYFVIPAQLFFIVFYERKSLQKYLSALGLGVISLLPWLFIFPKQLLNGLSTAQTLSGWRDVVGGANLKNAGLLITKLLIGRISFDQKIIYGLVVLIFLTVFYGLALASVKKKPSRILVLWLLAAPVLGFLISFFIPVFSYFRFMYLLPPLYILVAASIEDFEILKKFLIGLVLILEVLASFTYLLNPKFQREDWKGAVSFVDSIDHGDTKVVFKDENVLSGYTYYTKKGVDGVAGFNRIPAMNTADINITSFESASHLIVFDYLTDITDPEKELDKELSELGYVPIKTTDFQGVGAIYEYSRK